LQNFEYKADIKTWET